jgi:hypothetical protein
MLCGKIVGGRDGAFIRDCYSFRSLFHYKLPRDQMRMGSYHVEEAENAAVVGPYYRLSWLIDRAIW